MSIERRFLLSEQRLVKPDQDEGKTIVGYAARFNEPSAVLCEFCDGVGFVERILPGAFAGPISEGQDVRALFNHTAMVVLGRRSVGTLILEEDANGLLYRIKPPDAQDVRDLMARMVRGEIRESSFAFWLDEAQGDATWDDAQTPPLRTIHRVRQLYDVGPVTYPAYPTTSSGVRDLATADQVLAAHLRAIGRGHEWEMELRRRRQRLIEALS